MGSSKRLALISACGLACASTWALVMPAARASNDAYVLGDSIGEGVADASGLKKLAHISVHIRGPKAIAQINETPIGAVAFIVLGTNDADGSIDNIGKSIDDVVRAGERRKLRMIWLGPPCVRRPFDSRSRELDRILTDRLANTSVRYISMRDDRICSGVFHEPDGVHLTMKGYRYIWEKVSRAVSWPHLADARSGEAPTAPATVAVIGDTTGSVPAAPPTNVAAVPPQEDSAGIGQMVVEVHRPTHMLLSPIVWTEVSRR